MIDFDAIKARHRIEDFLTRRGHVLHKVAGGFATRCPVHDGKKPKSLFIHAAKQWCKCWTECGYIGSVIDLVMALDGASGPVEAAEILEGRPLTLEERERPRPQRMERLRLTPERECKELPKFYKGERRHFEIIARARGLHWLTVKLAHDAGHVRFCQVGWREGQLMNCYAVLDVGNPVNVQFRRMDVNAETGKALPFWDDIKVMGWKGNQGNWPVGIDSALTNKAAPIVLVEGTGDYLAAWYLRDMGFDVVPVAIFGAGNQIAPMALPFFERREVIIVQQHDEAAAKGAERWAAQLEAVGARVRVWLVPSEGEDLNDYISSEGSADAIMELSNNVPALPTASAK